MTLSLNEVDALAKKATRGAGHSWGMAEDAGKALRWLCAADIDGCAALAKLLTQCDGGDLSDHTPLPGDIWTSRGDWLCPLLTGAALSDTAGVLNEREIELANVAYPILLAPFAGFAAHHVDDWVCLALDDAHVATNGDVVVVAGNVDAAVGQVAVRVLNRPGIGQTQAKRSRANPHPDALSVLHRFAHRTYAPATDASRRSGAGAGLSDND